MSVRAIDRKISSCEYLDAAKTLRRKIVEAGTNRFGAKRKKYTITNLCDGYLNFDNEDKIALAKMFEKYGISLDSESTLSYDRSTLDKRTQTIYNYADEFVYAARDLSDVRRVHTEASAQQSINKSSQALKAMHKLFDQIVFTKDILEDNTKLNLNVIQGLIQYASYAHELLVIVNGMNVILSNFYRGVSSFEKAVITDEATQLNTISTETRKQLYRNVTVTRAKMISIVNKYETDGAFPLEYRIKLKKFAELHVPETGKLYEIISNTLGVNF